MKTLDEMLEGKNQDTSALEEVNFEVDGSKLNEGDLSYTEKMHQGNEQNVIGIKNVSDRKGKHRGIIYPIPMGNGNTATVKPGQAIPLPRKMWDKIRTTRNVHGDLAFEECDLRECDVDITVLRKTDQPFNPRNEVDDTLIETIFLAIKNEVHQEVVDLLSTCNSIATLQFVMREIDSSSSLKAELKTTYSKFLIQRISALRKAEMR